MRAVQSDQAPTYADATLAALRASLCAGIPVRIQVIGSSMWPLLNVGDAIHVVQIAPNDLRRGDTLVVWRDEYFVTHRLVAVDQAGYHTKGDHCWALDAPTAAATILGRVYALERAHQVIDLRQRHWIVVSRVLGWTEWLEGRAAEIGQARGGRIINLGMPLRACAVAVRIINMLLVFMSVRFSAKG